MPSRILRLGFKVFRLRYIAAASAVSGSYVVSKRYNDIKSQMPDFGAWKAYLPTEDQMDKVVGSMQSFWDKASITNKDWYKSFKTKSANNYANLQDWYSNKRILSPPEIKAPLPVAVLDALGLVQVAFLAAEEPASTEKTSSVSRLMGAFSQSSSQKDEVRKIEELQQEIIDLQIRSKKEIENLEKENRELKRQILLKKQKSGQREMKKSLIDMYSEVLDELGDYDSAYNAQDHLPRVVVVGDQSAGKTSVLEMIAQARIFPRGAGEMMTRSPVKVTLSEGPYHIARFKDNKREFDLTKESELEALRKEIEIRMKASVTDGRTISTDTISISVQGPRLRRMVLVDLPGIISTVTQGMNDDTKDSIRSLVKTHMENPNAIILCIQDGSIDAERSNVTDLVSSMDPMGKRTIFVLTKVDLAESSLYNPDRIKKILEGRLFPMKALGYFAVVTGKGSKDDSIASIKAYEEKFFQNSKLFREGVLKSTQMTTDNLSKAVSEKFWKMVKESVEQQADSYKAQRFNLETEWKNTFPNLRQLDREELFEKARGEILDQLVSLSTISPATWEDKFKSRLWDAISDDLFENILTPAIQQVNLGRYQTLVDIKLRDWVDDYLPKVSVKVGRNTLYDQLNDIHMKETKQKNHDQLFDNLKIAAHKETFRKHTWDEKAEKSLRVIQETALEDASVHNKNQWLEAIQFMEKALEEKIIKSEKMYSDLIGPSAREQWMSWKSRSTIQKNRLSVMLELEKILQASPKHGINLMADEITATRKNLQAKNIDVDNDFIRESWHHLYRKHILRRSLVSCRDCRKSFYYYQQGIETSNDNDCREVVLFWRVLRMLDSTANALRQQVTNNEIRRLEKIMKDTLEEYEDDRQKLSTLLTGKRVQLAEDLKRVRQIQEKLEQFISALNKDK